MAIKILIADDHALLRQGIKRVLKPSVSRKLLLSMGDFFVSRLN